MPTPTPEDRAQLDHYIQELARSASTSDEFEVVGRLVLGCLFSTILATTLVASQLTGFFQEIAQNKIPTGGVVLLLPFLAGYSITLVLNLLEKAISAIELTIGIEDRRVIALDERHDGTRPRGRRVRP